MVKLVSWIEPQFDISKCFNCLQTAFTKQIRSYQSRPGLPCGAMDWDPIYDGAVKRPQYGERQTNSGGVRPKQRFNWKQRLIAFAHILEPSHLSFLNDVNLRQRSEKRAVHPSFPLTPSFHTFLKYALSLLFSSISTFVWNYFQIFLKYAL